MKLFVALFVLFLVPDVTHGGCCECTLNDLLSLNTYIKSAVTSALENSKITCTDVNARGALVSCPATYIATSCSCGMACGSWDIRSDATCHCQCANIDWTSARCCKMTYN